MEDLSGQIEQLQEEIIKVQSDVERKRQQIQQIQEKQTELQQLKIIQEEQEKLIRELQLGSEEAVSSVKSTDSEADDDESIHEEADGKDTARSENISLEDVQEQLADFGNNLHEKNRRRIRGGLWCIAIVPLIFMVLMFSMDTAKVVYLLLWVISLFVLCTYLVVVEYIDDRLQRRLDELNVEMTHSQPELIGSDLRAFINSMMSDEE
jgi:Fe2+ transport system protein B